MLALRFRFELELEFRLVSATEASLVPIASDEFELLGKSKKNYTFFDST